MGNLVGFGRFLRNQGLTVGSNQVITFLQALEHVDLLDQGLFFHTAETSLVTRVEDRARFQRAFESYWGRPPAGRPGQGAPEGGPPWGTTPSVGGGPEVQVGSPSQQRGPAADPDDGGGMLYSAVEVLRHKNFAELTDSERAAVGSLIRRVAFGWGTRKSRRWIAGAGRRVELRRSLRLNLRHGGEWLRWARRHRKVVERPLVLLADISGSMKDYSRLLLQFAYGMVRGSQAEIEAFVFGTRLTRITPALRTHKVERALARVASDVPDWDGGTRIGAALRRFNLDWARRVLVRRPVVLIVSDAWDRGDPQVLGREVARLRRSAHSLIWLNPRMGDPAYRPLTRGLQAALPHVDQLLPAHNLSSLQGLVRVLERLPSGASGPHRRPPIKRVPMGGRLQ